MLAHHHSHLRAIAIRAHVTSAHEFPFDKNPPFIVSIFQQGFSEVQFAHFSLAQSALYIIACLPTSCCSSKPAQSNNQLFFDPRATWTPAQVKCCLWKDHFALWQICIDFVTQCLQQYSSHIYDPFGSPHTWQEALWKTKAVKRSQSLFAIPFVFVGSMCLLAQVSSKTADLSYPSARIKCCLVLLNFFSKFPKSNPFICSLHQGCKNAPKFSI